MIGIASEVTSVPIFFFLENLKYVQSFVKRKVSLADGIYSLWDISGNAVLTRAGSKTKKKRGFSLL
jgi:hypothetical protein